MLLVSESSLLSLPKVFYAAIRRRVSACLPEQVSLQAEHAGRSSMAVSKAPRPCSSASPSPALSHPPPPSSQRQKGSFCSRRSHDGWVAVVWVDCCVEISAGGDLYTDSRVRECSCCAECKSDKSRRCPEMKLAPFSLCRKIRPTFFCAR